MVVKVLAGHVRAVSRVPAGELTACAGLLPLDWLLGWVGHRMGPVVLHGRKEN